MEDIYYTIASNIRREDKIKKCKFITSIKNVTSKAQAEEFIQQVSEKYSDATHNVPAYKVGFGAQAKKACSDDGEPAGSSGPPALQALEGKNLTNVAVVVTRYFGGVKHGVGGLVRAYGGSVREAIKEAGIIKKQRYVKLAVEISYDLMGQVINDLEGKSAQIKETNYTNQGVEIIALMKPGLVAEFKSRITDATRGEAVFELKGNEFR